MSGSDTRPAWSVRHSQLGGDGALVVDNQDLDRLCSLLPFLLQAPQREHPAVRRHCRDAELGVLQEHLGLLLTGLADLDTEALLRFAGLFLYAEGRDYLHLRLAARELVPQLHDAAIVGQQRLDAVDNGFALLREVAQPIDVPAHPGDVILPAGLVDAGREESDQLVDVGFLLEGFLVQQQRRRLDGPLAAIPANQAESGGLVGWRWLASPEFDDRLGTVHHEEAGPVRTDRAAGEVQQPGVLQIHQAIHFRIVNAHVVVARVADDDALIL